MFETRLRLVFAGLILLMAGLALRAFQIQVTGRDHWQELARTRLQESTRLEPTRGRILDVRGRELAVNKACIDVCVDYRAITSEPDEKWVREQAMARLKQRQGELYRQASPAQAKQMRLDQIAQVRRDIQAMWATLGREDLTGKTPEQIEQTRQEIVQRVESLQRYACYTNYVQATRKYESRPAGPWYWRWLGGVVDQAPQIDQFDVSLTEQHSPHVVLPAVSAELANYLGKNLDRMPGLELRPGQHRDYPYGPNASHVIGYLNRVPAADAPNPADPDDDLTRYLRNDLMGCSGVEAMCEQLLRGRRGRIVRSLADDTVLQARDPLQGQDVQLSIDIELEQKIEDRFAHPVVDGQPVAYPMYGGAVVIDVPTGQVRAMVSYPTFDLNELDTQYAHLVTNDIDRPLMNRATQFALEPGSTVKPMVGIAGLADKVIKPYEGIECTGYLVLDGRKYREGRCWTASKGLDNCSHHPVPFGYAHHGTHGNPDGFLTVAEALERSCNVFFETVADRLDHLETNRLATWMRRFGLGEPVGIGLKEASGRLVDDYEGPAGLRRMTNCIGGIGQGQVQATPLQMANVAATIARDGLWIRPTLIASGAATPAADESSRRRIPADAAIFAVIKQGMRAVVNEPAGTGHALRLNSGVIVAGKTGTAQAARFSIPRRDAGGKLIRVGGRVEHELLEPSTTARPNPLAPWYRGTGKTETELSHAWFIGYAPAENPQIAFAVFVEYGGNGGAVAGGIAKGILETAIAQGYVTQQNR